MSTATNDENTTTVAALRAHENARLPASAYDEGMRPAAARARDADPVVRRDAE
jgi:hypothetical protein